MSKTNKLAFMAAVMLTVAIGTNVLEANARTRFEKLRIAPVQRTAHAHKYHKPTPMPLMYNQRSVATSSTHADEPAQIQGSNSLIQ